MTSIDPRPAPAPFPLRAVEDPEAEAWRTPPHNIEAEQSLLGAMLLSREAADGAFARVRESDFYRPSHQLVFAAMQRVANRNEPVDSITVYDDLFAAGEANRVGGATYLHTLTAVVPTAANYSYYAEIVVGHAMLRGVIETCTTSVEEAYSADYRVAADIIGRAQAALQARESRRDQLPLITDDLAHTLYAVDNPQVNAEVRFPYHDLDRMTDGLPGGTMTIIAGRPGTGKTMVALDIARYAAFKLGKTVLFLSLEMSREPLNRRLLAAEAGVPHKAIKHGTVTAEQRAKLAATVERLSQTPNLIIDDTSAINVNHIKSRVRELTARRDVGAPDLIIVDYLQIMTGVKGRYDSKVQEVAEISTTLRNLGRELGIPVVALAQFNRNPDGRQGGRPIVSDLKESGQIEQDADVVLMLHRDDENPDMMEIIVGKNRDGEQGSVSVLFQGALSRCVSMARQTGTCAECKEPMTIIEPGQTVHPNCKP